MLMEYPLYIMHELIMVLNIYIYTIYIFTMVMGYTTKTNLSTLNVLQALHFLKHIHICVFKIYVLKHIHICVSKRNDKNIFDLNIK